MTNFNEQEQGKTLGQHLAGTDPDNDILCGPNGCGKAINKKHEQFKVDLPGSEEVILCRDCFYSCYSNCYKCGKVVYNDDAIESHEGVFFCTDCAT